MKIPTIRQLPSGNYFCQLRIDGQSISITDPDYDKVYAKAVAYKTGIMDVRRSPQNQTLRKAIDDYINARTQTLSPSTIRGYRTIQNYRFQTVADKPLSNIKNWQKIINQEASTCSPKTLTNAWHLITAVLTDNNITPPTVRLPQVVKNERPWLDPDQITVFIKEMAGQVCEIPALLALHSLRRSEICGLQWKDVDLKKGLIHVNGAAVFDENQNLIVKPTNKNTASNRVIPIMIPALKEALESVEDKTGLVVKVTPHVMYKHINKTCAKLGFPQVGVHGLRHSFASLAYHLGLPERECMALGGWSNQSTMHEIYTHISAHDVARAANKMADFYGSENSDC